MISVFEVRNSNARAKDRVASSKSLKIKFYSGDVERSNSGISPVVHFEGASIRALEANVVRPRTVGPSRAATTFDLFGL